MTLKEAKKILKKEGYFLVKVSKGFEFSELPVWEKQEVVEAKRVVNENGFATAMSTNEWLDRQERLKKEYEKNTKAPGRGEEQPKEKKGIIYPTTFPKADFYHKHVLNEGNPAIKESASQFNEALLGEQAKEIKRLGKEIARLNGIIHDKNAILSDVAEELRLTKIREKNLVEVSQKYMKENEELKEQLADNVVDKIDAQALKSAESALAYKEKVIAEKDEVIADLTHELKAKKALADHNRKMYDASKINLQLREKGLERLKNELEDKTKLVEWVRNASKEYCDYGVAANEFIKELAGLYVLANNNGIINDEMLERCKNYQTYGFPANFNRETKKEINDIARGKENKKPRIPTPEEPKHGNSLKDFIKKTIDNYNRKAANLGCVGSNDGNGIFYQMVGADIAEEGGDHSDVIVLCGKDFIDAINKMK